jgi:hypothetical protein
MRLITLAIAAIALAGASWVALVQPSHSSIFAEDRSGLG